MQSRVEVLQAIGELLDAGLLTSEEAGECIQFVMRSGVNVDAVSDLLKSRRNGVGQAQFLKLFFNNNNFDWIDNKASPPMRFPTAVRPMVPFIFEEEDRYPKESPESGKSTNVGSSPVDGICTPDRSEVSSVPPKYVGGKGEFSPDEKVLMNVSCCSAIN